jgi:hypothetical protein
MASSYSTDLKIELINTGEQSGDWGNTTNSNFTNVFEDAIVGRSNPEFPSDANYTITLTDTVSVQAARFLYLNVTSAVSLSTTRDLVVPTINKPYIVENNTSGGQAIVVKTSAGTGITVPNGRRIPLYVNGTNVVTAWDYMGENVSVAVGTTVQRPASPKQGAIRFNTTNNQYEGYDGTAWGQLGGGATGGGGDEVFVENGVTVTTSYTLSTGKNAESVGPITIDSGATVTIPSGQRWVVI